MPSESSANHRYFGRATADTCVQPLGLLTPRELDALRTCRYARPNTTPRIKKEKYTLCAEWTMMPIQVLRKRQLGNAYRKTPLITDARIPQGWWKW